jgi:hypothetical protein
VIDESELQCEKHFDPRISIFRGSSIFDSSKRSRINLCCTTSIRRPFSRTKISFPDSIEIDDRVTSINAEPSTN